MQPVRMIINPKGVGAVSLGLSRSDYPRFAVNNSPTPKELNTP